MIAQKVSAYLNALVPHVRNGFIPSLITSYGLIGLTILIQLILVPLYIHHLGKEYFGILAIFFSVINFSNIGVTWIAGGMARMMGECAALDQRQKMADAYALSKFLYTIYAVVLVLLFWLIAPFALASIFLDRQIFFTTIFTCIYIFLALTYSADRLALMSIKCQTRANIFDAIGQVIFALCAVTTLYTDMGLMGIAAAQILGILSSHLLARITWTQKEFHMRWPFFPRPEWRPLWDAIAGQTGKNYAIYGILVLLLQSDALIIGAIAGPVYLADYYLLWRIPDVLILIFWRVPSALTPYIIHMQALDQQDKIDRIYKQGGFVMATFVGLLCLLYAIFGHSLIGLWVGADQAPKTSYGYMLAGMAAFLIATAKWPTIIAYALGRIRPLILAASCELVGKLILFIAFLPTLGYISPIAAVVTIYGLGVSWMYFRAMKRPQ